MFHVNSERRHLSTAEFIVMISVLILVGLTEPGAASAVAKTRSKRNVIQLCEMIALHTSRGCMDYNNYGCFCGLGNAASHHVDGVDGCCRAHDRCYGRVSCFWFLPQVVGYNFACEDGECTCTDSPLFASCARSTCDCDLAFARCLQGARYNRAFKDYDREECTAPRRRRRRIRKAKKHWAKRFFQAIKSRFF